MLGFVRQQRRKLRFEQVAGLIGEEACQPLSGVVGCLEMLEGGFETFGVRLLSLSLENTVFTFAAILAVYLLGQAIGAVGVDSLQRLEQRQLAAPDLE